MAVEDLEPLSPAEIMDLQARQALDRDMTYTPRERAYLIGSLLEIRRLTREKIMTYLMEINRKVLADRAEDAILVANGQITDSILNFHDGILTAIANTGAYVTEVGDEIGVSLAPKALREYMLEAGAATDDFDLFEGYRILAGYFGR